MKKLFLLLLCLPVFLPAQSPWSDISKTENLPVGERFIFPKKWRAVALDLAVFKNQLTAATDWFDEKNSQLVIGQEENWTSQLAENQPVIVEIPLPGGSFQAFKIWRADVLHPDLASQFPDIKSYAGQAVGDRSTSIRFDLTPAGFHAQILSATENTIFIDPIFRGDAEHYQVYFKKDCLPKKGEKWVCHVGETGNFDLPTDPDFSENGAFVGDCGKLRRYRLALSCTGEYTTFHGGTVAGALAAMNTTMMRVNGIYERDLAVTMQIIGNNNLLIFTNAATDPFDNDDIGQMIGENQTQCDTKIGNANYDIGHVFGTSGGGLACFGCVCSMGGKATAGTGLGSPVGDVFDVDYVAHEIGHQFRGRHSFNNSCGGNRDDLAAAEPGSGSTIMAYAGICGPNVQNNSDDYFHAINLQVMSQFIVSGGGAGCDFVINTANIKPVVANAVDRTVPKSTPFSLTGSATDANSDDVLSYCWEQMDLQIGAMPPAATNSVGPMFRSLKPVAGPTRHFPNLADLVAGVNTTWERLPSVARTMNFRLTVRDNFVGGGCTSEDNVLLTVNAVAGPFVVTAPNTTGISWDIGSTKTVTWDVAGTTASPVSCANVRLLLSTDGGLSYPIILQNSVANNGSATVSVPNNASTTCRVRVEAVGNVFFDISDKNFTIKAPTAPTFVVVASPGQQLVCAGSSATYLVDLQAIAGFSSPVNLSVSGLPPGATGVFSMNPAAPGTQPTLLVSNLNVAAQTDFTLTISAVSGAISQSQTVVLTVLPGAPAASVSLNYPTNYATGIGTVLVLKWAAAAGATSYFVEIASSPTFSAGSILASSTTAATSFFVANLSLSTVYWWRVRPANFCGDGPGSAAFSFQTGTPACSQTFNSTNVPIQISTSEVDSVNSSLTIPGSWFVTDLNVSLQIDHTYMGDVAASLVSPLGISVNLFDQPGLPGSDFGCPDDDVLATFDDEAALTAADFEATCNNVTPTISGTYQSAGSLAAFDGPDAAGTWQLVVEDKYPEDGGEIAAWNLTVCYTTGIAPAVLLQNSPLVVPKNGTGQIGQNLLFAQTGGPAAQVVFMIFDLPNEGVLKLNGSPIGLFGTFTQADVNNGLLVYKHGGSAANADFFGFDLLNQAGQNWLPGQIFTIQIVQNTLSASLAVTQGIGCANGQNGSVEVSTTGGNAPLSFSLNGGSGQNSPVFGGLAAGNYVVLVSDNLGFEFTTNVVVLQNPVQIAVTVSVNTDDVTAVGTGGTGGLTYSIDGQNFSPNPIFEDLPNGVYSIIVQDLNGCSASVQAVVAVNSLLIGAQIQAQIGCFGESSGAIQVTTGGGQAPFSYSLNGGPGQDSALFEGLGAGVYQVVVTDSQGFSATSNTLVLNEPTHLTASLSTSYYQISVSASGGTGALSYSIDGQNFQAAPNFTAPQNDQFTVVVKDQAGCTISATATIDVPPLTNSATIVSTIKCAGENTGVISATANGGQPGYEFSLNGINFQNSPDFGGLAAGSYSIVVRDAAGFTTSSTVILDEPTLLTVSFSNFTDNLTAMAAGGTGGYEFSIDGQNFSVNNLFENLSNGSYTIFVRDANGCLATASATIDFTPLSMTANGHDASCFGQTDGFIFVNAAGGLPPIEFSINGQNFSGSDLFENLAAGNYTIYVKDGEGSILTQNLTISQPSEIVLNASALGSTVTAAATGGGGGFQFQLDGGVFSGSGIFQDVPPGNHLITVRDNAGCEDTLSIQVAANTLTINTLDFQPVSCAGGSDGQFTICLDGGLPPFSLSILPATGLQTPVSGACILNIQMSGLASGSYQITATDAQNFSQFLTVNLPEPAVLTASALVNLDTATVGGAGGSGNLSYSIDGQNFQPTGQFSGLPNGNYTATVRDQNGCTTTIEFEIMVISTDEIGATFGLKISPNPTTGLLQLVVNQSVATGFQLKIMDAAGRILRNETAFLPTVVDLGGLPEGVYFLSLNDGERQVVRRILRVD